MLMWNEGPGKCNKKQKQTSDEKFSLNWETAQHIHEEAQNAIALISAWSMYPKKAGHYEKLN